MTYEEKARAYDELLDKAKQIYNKENDVLIKHIIEGLFPELKESEDEWVEKIKKDIVSYLKHRPIKSIAESGAIERCLAWLEKQGSAHLSWSEEDNNMLKWVIEYLRHKMLNTPISEERIACKNAIAWLEKQGEQKPTDKVEPKFKNGKWIVWQNKCYKVNYNGCGYELIDQNGLSTSLEYGTVEESAHLWTIQDAKDGDVLKEDSCTFIIERMKSDGTAIIHCCLFDDGDFELGSTLGFDVDSTYPATKEQRDLLFQKMKEAGYEFDFEKKELRKTEWNPQPGDTFRKKGTDSPIYHLCGKREDGINFGFVEERENGAAGGEISIFALKNEYELVERLRPFEKFIEEEFNKALQTKVEYNHACTKEDEKMIQALDACIDVAIKSGMNYISFDSKSILIGKVKNWLKSLKDRVMPQSKQEWSEEDKWKINRIYSILRQATDTHAFCTSCRLIGDKECMDLQDFLKSLKQRIGG